MSRERRTVLPFLRPRGRPPRSAGRRRRRAWGTGGFLALLALVALLKIADLLGLGGAFPTLLDFLSGGEARSTLPATLEGTARVIDGDTLDVAGRRVRLFGIDAPEREQACADAAGASYPCGERAAAALAVRIGGAAVRCEERDTDRYGRIVAVCTQAGSDLNAWLVGQGWAMAYRRFSHDYGDDEAHARTAGRGLWQGAFTAPWEWRAARREAPPARPARTEAASPAVGSPAGCRIKGNVSSKGARIYHVPGGRDYAATRIDAGKGERWFCSESEAAAAGWRPARP